MTRRSEPYVPAPEQRDAHLAESRRCAEAETGSLAKALRWRLHHEEPYASPQEFIAALPDPVTRVFLITGWQSKTAEDFCGALEDRQKRVVTRRAVELGTERTPQDLARAIAAVPDRPGHVVALVRGGAGDGGLWAFDHPDVVRAILACRSTVITSIGHRADVTVADLVADASRPVPGDLGREVSAVLSLQRSGGVGTPVTDTSTAGRAVPLEGAEEASPPATKRTVAAAPRPRTTPSLRRGPAPHPGNLSPMAPDSLVPSGPRTTRAPRGLGTASLILGVLSIVTLGGLGIGPLVGVILGLSDVRRRPRGVAMAGIALNGLALCGLAAFILLLVVLGLGRTDPGGSPSF